MPHMARSAMGDTPYTSLTALAPCHTAWRHTYKTLNSGEDWSTDCKSVVIVIKHLYSATNQRPFRPGSVSSLTNNEVMRYL